MPPARAALVRYRHPHPVVVARRGAHLRHAHGAAAARQAVGETVQFRAALVVPATGQQVAQKRIHGRQPSGQLRDELVPQEGELFLDRGWDGGHGAGCPGARAID